MLSVTVQKRGSSYQYKFEIASIDGKRKFISKSGFNTKGEAKKAGILAVNEYMNLGQNFKANTMSLSDYLDYWLKEHCSVNLKYNTIQAYLYIIKNHIKPRLGFYMLSQITTKLQEFINDTYIKYGFSKKLFKKYTKSFKNFFCICYRYCWIYKN